MVSDRGAVEITEGKRPPLDATVDGDPQVLTRAQKRPDDNETGATDSNPEQDATEPVPAGQFRNSGGQAQSGDRQPNRAEVQAEKARQEKAAFAKAASEIRAAVEGDPALAEMAKQLSIDMTPEGLQIQIKDEDKLPMFATGSAAPNDRARALIQKVAPFLQKLPEAISIAGYTDATPYAGLGKTNWELSSDRANATRRLLTDSGLADSRIRTVTGHADRDPLLPGEPLAAANRRIAIVVLRDAVAPPPADHAPAQSVPTPQPADRAPQPADHPSPSANKAPAPTQPADHAPHAADPVH
jgi:chemotaxis protein MotB